jgi:hypothetical protein
VVSVLELDPRFVDSSPTEGDGILRALQILSTTFFGGKENPSVTCRMILWRVKETERHEKYFAGKIRWRIFLSNFLLLCY